MAHQLCYVEDLVTLKTNDSRIGQVDRTASDVSTHTPSPASDYGQHITRGKGISKPLYKKFLRTGVPPRGTVLVNWTSLPWQDDLQPIIIKETELKLVDRSLLAGDVVKRNVSDPMSGIVLETRTTASLVQPSKWPTATSRSLNIPGSYEDEPFGNYMPRFQDMLHEVSTEDLRLSADYEPDSFVLYKNWVGRVQDVYEDIYVRLSNGSVVVVEDPDELETHTPEDTPNVGDFVRATKANLRRGRWIYGSYDPNIEPCGYVADVRPTSVEVQWLAPSPNSSAYSDAPPYELDQDTIQSGEVIQYDRTRPHRSGLKEQHKKLDLDLCPGDTVRFRDIAGAAVKYHEDRVISPDGSRSCRLQRIARTESLGFDINVYMVAKTSETVTVQWQDQTVTTMHSTQVMPFLDMAESGDVWPGELVALEGGAAPGEDVVKPPKVGVVQSCNASDRTARVKWFTNAQVSYATVDGQASLLHGSSTGELSKTIEDVSLYEVSTVPGMERRLGDFVCLVPIEKLDEMIVKRPELQDYAQIVKASADDQVRQRNWFGEVIALGLDGLLTIRLAGAESMKDVQAPWEGTLLLASTDLDDADDMAPEDMDIDYDDMTDDDAQMTMDEVASELGFDDTPWVDEDDHVVEEVADEGWETEEEEDDAQDDGHKVEKIRTERPATEPVAVDDHTITSSVPTLSTFSYTSMFSDVPTSQEEQLPQPFAVVDSAVPSDHGFTTTSLSSALSGTQLRRIQKEHKILHTSLPAGVFVRSWESRLDLLRVLILGPVDTPYEFAPFIVDMWLDPDFPQEPPRAYFHSWTAGTGPVNPNLYEDGKICLSLLGTWPGDDRNETWSSKSTILQIIVSILGLVLVKEPYYNEAGYDVRMGTLEAKIPSQLYCERTFFKSRGFIQHALTKGVPCFEQELQRLYLPDATGRGPQLLRRAILDAVETIRRSEAEPDKSTSNDRRLSVGALIPLRRQVAGLLAILEKKDKPSADRLSQAYHDKQASLPNFP